MKLLLLSLAVFYVSFGDAKRRDAYSGARKIPNLSCRTMSGHGCVFPFHHNGVEHRHCTTAGNAEGAAWCPYQIQEHEDGTRTMTKWDYCNTAVCVVKDVVVTTEETSEEPTTAEPTTEEPITTEPTVVETTTVEIVETTIPVDPRDGVDADEKDGKCITESGPGSGQACKFPFHFHGQTHNSCIRWSTPGRDYGKYWCFTEGGEHGSYQSYGFCGFCDNPACGCSMTHQPHPRNTQPEPQQTTTIAPEETTTEEPAPETTTVVDEIEEMCLTEDEKPCQFPFKFHGHEYSSCAQWKWPGKNEGKLWCSTKTDEHGNHVKGNFGYCQHTFACISP